MKRAVLALPLGFLALVAACSEPAQDESAEATPREQQALEDFLAEARRARDHLDEKIATVEREYANAENEAAGAWAESSREIANARQDLEAGLTRMRDTTRLDPDQIRGEIVGQIETLTERVERASLMAADDGQEFMTTARRRLSEIQDELRSLRSEATELPNEARAEIAVSLDELESEANELMQRIASLAAESPEEIEDERDDLSASIAALSASVRREWLEMRGSS